MRWLGWFMPGSGMMPDGGAVDMHVPTGAGIASKLEIKDYAAIGGLL